MESIPRLYFSQNLKCLAKRLIEELDEDPIDPLETRTILVPSDELKQWLLLEIAKQRGIAMGGKVVTVRKFFPLAESSLELFCKIYSALQESQEESVLAYLDGKNKRLLELTAQLSGFFTKYVQYESLLETSWQTELFHKLVRIPQWEVEESIICFGIDYLPPLYWKGLLSAPHISCYFFSPCAAFWEDALSDWEQRKIKVEHKTPRLLGNWGDLGRRTLRTFDYTDTEELYLEKTPTCALMQLQQHLLSFEEAQGILVDDSVGLICTGSSRRKEIEFVREEILRLQVAYHEVLVLAPDIEPYIPWIEYLFGKELPYRIAGCQMSQGSFRQGLLYLMGMGRWDAEAILSLFETPSFYRKRGWDAEVLQTFRGWITKRIHWGRDAAHRKTHLQEMLGQKEFIDEGSWEKGLDALLESLIYLTDEQVNADLLENLLEALFLLKSLDLQGEKTLAAWADCLDRTAELCLKIDLDDEADQAMHEHFRAVLKEMRQVELNAVYPLEVVQRFLFRPFQGSIHFSELHAVRFSSIAEGAILPAKAVFLIGMDEMSFPRVSVPSSLDLLKGKIPDRAEIDRYLFLQALFAPSEYLRISYGHLSADEGKQVNPSLVVQEWMGAFEGLKPQIFAGKASPELKKHLVFPHFVETALPKGEKVIAIQELRQLATHSWRFFLKKMCNIQVEEELEATFALQRGKLVKALFEEEPLEEMLLGPLQDALYNQACEKIEERKEQLQEWQVEPFTLVLKEFCAEKKWEKNRLIMPAVVVEWEDLKIKLVGEIQQVSSKGLISLYKDDIAGTLKVWPEALIAAVALDAPQILILKNGKQKLLKQPQESLKAFLLYYFHSLIAPSPLLPQWADPLLRQPTLKKMRPDVRYEDPLATWVLARMEGSVEEMGETWQLFLRQAFSELIPLYPTRGAR